MPYENTGIMCLVGKGKHRRLLCRNYGTITLYDVTLPQLGLVTSKECAAWTA